jgi:hypothetical protein
VVPFDAGGTPVCFPSERFYDGRRHDHHLATDRALHLGAGRTPVDDNRLPTLAAMKTNIGGGSVWAERLVLVESNWR